MTGVLTTVVAPLSTRLTTRANVKLDLKISGSADDDYIDLLIDRASSMIQPQIGRPLGSQTVLETYRAVAASGKPLILSLFPVSAVASVTESGVALAADAFERDDRSGLLWRLSSGSRASWCSTPVAVSYTAGWRLPNDAPVAGIADLPFDIQDIALGLVRQAWFARGGDPTIRSEEAPGLGRIVYQTTGASAMALDDASAERLRSYRTVVI